MSAHLTICSEFSKSLYMTGPFKNLKAKKKAKNEEKKINSTDNTTLNRINKKSHQNKAKTDTLL